MNLDFRKKLLSGKTMIGTIVTQPNPAMAEILADVGFDWLWIDAEHTPMGMGDVQGILQAVADRCACVVRVPTSNEVYIKKALDIGAPGIIAPHVDTVEIAERVVKWVKYPPIGERSIGVARAHGYGLDIAGYMHSANDQIAVIVQIEHVKGAQDIDKILNVAGVDAVIIGPYDLSGSLGKPGQIEDPEVQGYIDRVREACLKCKKPIGIIGISVDAAKPFLDQGFSLIAVGIDTMIFGHAARDIVAEMKGEYAGQKR
ncbi:MAG: 2,4-dihydroxyhept-2-ene-1,7-dioic acid aldolase [Deltaproteobacteria bacterium]|nr:2,4-dihydroxyhept-2-ene-1,7-dioic acid aldolase [Deltaproteobacteria bacterium]